MIKLFYGPKGSGKTKRIIAYANDYLNGSKGDVVYITDNSKHSIELSHAIRFIDAKEYGITCESCAMGFVKGVVASNNDIVLVCIDGLARLAGLPTEQLENFYKMLEKLSASDLCDFVLTVSCESLPPFLKKYV